MRLVNREFDAGRSWSALERSAVQADRAVGTSSFAKSDQIASTMATVSVAADEPVGSIAPGGTVTGIINTTGDIDYFNINLLAGQTYSIALAGSGPAPLANPFLSLASGSTILIRDDDGGVGRNALLTFTAGTTGSYRLIAEGHSGAGLTGEYTLDVRQMGADSVGATLASATVIAVGSTTLGFIESSGDVDMYGVTLVAGQYYTIEVAGGADYGSNPTSLPRGELDTRMSIYDASGSQVASNNDLSYPEDISSGLGFTASGSGTFYVQVDAYPRQAGGYTLQVEQLDLSASDPLDTIDWGTQLSINAATVYFARAGESFDGVSSLGWTAYEIEQAMEALQTYAEVSNLTFSLTTNPNGATFRLVTTQTSEFLGYFIPPGETNSGVGVFSISGDGWNTSGGLDQGGFGFTTLVHEFGHGLGLAHPHDDGGTSTIMPGVTSPFDSYGVFDLNQGIYTTMTYNEGWDKHPGGAETSLIYGHQGGPGALDIALVQLKYGAVSSNTGDTVYTLPTANVAGTFFDVIWDTGGNDTIAHTGTVSARIDLTEASLDYSAAGGGVVSYVNGVYGGFTIAAGAVVENASGGAGDDVLVGNGAANLLTGGAGADNLQGRGGDDTLDGGAGADSLTGDLGADTFKFKTGDGLDVVTDLESDDIVEISGYGAAQSITQSGSDVVVVLSSTDRITFQAATVSSVQAALHYEGSTINGTAGGETLIGTSGNDTIDGREGDDTIVGGAGSDSLTGDLGGDRLYSDAISPSVLVPLSQDTSAESDRLAGGAGNDHLFAGIGDTVDGGADSDALYINFQGATAGVHADFRDLMRDGSVTVGGATISRIEALGSIVGSGYNDFLAVGISTIHGAVHGMGGDDHIIAAYSTSNIYGGDGEDYIDARSNRATAQHYGDAGNDTMVGGLADDVFHGGDGNDILDGGELGDYLSGGAGDDTLIGGDSNDRLTGGIGSDTFVFKAGDNQDTVTDLAAGDIVQVSGYSSVQSVTQSGPDVLVVLSGTDQITFQNTTVAAVQSALRFPATGVNGTSGDDTVHGTSLNDTIYGYAGNDTLNGGIGADTMFGGLGNDTFYIDNVGDTANEAANEGTDHVYSSVNVYLAANVENLTLTGTATNGGGNAGSNTIFGNAQNNVLNGAVGADTMLGGAGNDIFYVDNAGDRVSEAANQGTDHVYSSMSFSLWTNVENLTLTGLATNGGGNALNNIIIGNAQNNVLNGDIGADTMLGGSGNDSFYVDNAGDRVSEVLNEGADHVYSSVSFTLWTNVENLTLTGSAISGGGNALNNTIIGNAQNNVINGDVGADIMLGGAGNDSFYVDNAGDQASEAANQGTDQVYSSVSFTLWSDVENLTLTGAGATNATGNAQNNVLVGNGAANTLGGAGGNDTLQGGTGADSFLFDSALNAATNVDKLLDFAAIDDTITLDDDIFAGLALGTLGANAFRAGSAAADADERIIYDSATGNILYDADGNGAGAAVLFAQVNIGTSLTNADFVIVG